MRNIARSTSWVALVCGLACTSVEPEQPASVTRALYQSQPGARALPRHRGGTGAADAEARAARAAWVDALTSPLIEAEWLEGVSIALISEGSVETYGYGALRDGGPVPDGRTLFEIGSITKTFTGLLLADLVRDGSVQLDQPVASLLPAGVSVPERDGRAITLLDLATHTSGLPRLPTNLWLDPLTEEQLLDPYAQYQVADLYEFLSSYTLPVVPGERFEYSNLGGGLLGHALSFAAGTSYEEAIECRISEPLGLKDTTLHPSAAQERRLATGHDPDLQPVPGWAFTPALEGAGALRSTAEDLGRYIAAELAADGPAKAHRRPRPLLESMALTQIPQRTTDQGEPIGLAWFFNGPDSFWHNGGTGGYSSFALVDQARDIGVAVLANTSTPLTDALGEQLHQLLAGNTPQPLDLPVFVQLDAAALEPCVGTYRFLDDSLEVTILREDNRLYAEVPGSRSRLYPTSPTTFYSKLEEAILRFEPEGAGQYTTLFLEYSADESYPATRL